VRTTTIRHRRNRIEIGPAHGVHRNAPGSRAVWLELVGAAPRQVLAGDSKLLRRESAAALDKAGEGWAQVGNTTVIALPAKPVTEARRLILVE